jgi:lipopolysaccharide heptosyltransferase II
MKILIIKPSSFGDIIQANPVIAALKSSYPGAEIHWLVFKAWEEAIDLFPGVSEKIVWDKKLGLKEYFRVIAEIQKASFDIVIDLQGLARTAIIAKLSGGKNIVGVPGMKEFSWLFIKEPFPESRKINAALRNLESVRYLTGKSFEPVFEMQVPEDSLKAAEQMLEKNGISEGDRLAAFIPAARGKAKTWLAEYYDELAGLLGKKYKIKAVALGAKGDGKQLENPKITDLTGRTSLKTLAAVLSRCEVVIGGDTGPVHLAAALGIASIAIFGGSDIIETSPISKNAVVISRNLNCSPCRGKPNCVNYPCLTSIKPQEVFETVEKILKI